MKSSHAAEGEGSPRRRRWRYSLTNRINPGSGSDQAKMVPIGILSAVSSSATETLLIYPSWG